jgi:hypothetical protein
MVTDPTTNPDGSRNDAYVYGNAGGGAFTFNPVSVPNLGLADYNFIDPLQVARQTYKQNVDIYKKSFDTGAGLVKRAVNDELNIFKDYYNQSSPFIRQATSQENAFNQSELLKNVEAGTPGGRQALLRQIADAGNFAQGNFSDKILDAAFEQNSRSLSADRLRASGFGQKSAFGDTLSNKYAVTQRFGMQQYGNDLISRSVGQSMNSLTSAPTRARSAETFPTTPSISPAATELQQGQTIAGLGTIQPDSVASMKINQEQYRTTQAQNRLNQLAAYDFQGQQFNSTGQYAAQVDNYNADQNEIQRVVSQNQQAQAASAAQSAQQEQSTAQLIESGVGLLNSPIGQRVVSGISEELFGKGTPSTSSGSGGGSEGTVGAASPILGSANYGAAQTTGGSDSTLSDMSSGQGSGGSLLGSDVSYSPSTISANQGIIDSPSLPDLADTSSIGGYVDTGTSNYKMSYSNSTPPPAGANPVSPLVAAELRNIGYSSVPMKANPAGFSTSSTNDLVHKDFTTGTDIRVTSQSPRQAVNSAMATHELALKDPKAFNDVPKINSSTSTLIKSLFSDPSKLINVDKFGNPKIGIDPKDAGIAIGTLPFDNLKESELAEIDSHINKHFENVSKLDWKGQNTEGAKFIGSMVDKVAKDDLSPTAAEDKEFTEHFTKYFQNTDRSGGDLRQGTDTANWIKNQAKDFGVFSKDATVKNPRAFAEAGVQGGALVQYWDKLSPKERMMGTHNVINSMISAHAVGDDLPKNLKVNETPIATSARYNVGTGMAGSDLAQRVSNWDRQNTLGRITSGARVIQDVDRLSEGIGAGSVVSNNTNQNLGAGATVAGGANTIMNTVENWGGMNNGQRALGAGNSIVAADNIHSAVTSTGTSTTAASATAGQSASTTGASVMAGVGTAVAVGGALYAGYNIASNWGQMDTASGAANGMALGASIGSLVPGIGTLAGAAVGAVLGAAIGQVRAGKHEDQMLRDNVRKGLADAGFLEKSTDGKGDYFLSLADGTKVDISAEHWEGGRTAYDPAKALGELGKREGGKLRPYEIDTTCDLDFMTSLGGKGLEALMGADAKTNLGGYFTNAATSNAGTRDFTEESFSKSMDNMRSFYEKAGFNSEEKVIQQGQALFDAGKLDQTGLDQMKQAASMIFAKNFNLAKTLNSTRNVGVENLK